MEPKSSKIEAKLGPEAPKWSQNGAKMGPRRPKHRKKTKTQQRGGWPFTGSPLFERKSGQHGPNLGPKTEPKTIKKRYQNQSKFWCLLGSVFGAFLVDFGRQNGPKLAPKTHQKSISTSEGSFYKKYNKINGILLICEVSRVEFGSKNQSKIDAKLESKMECLLASIFERF